MQKDTQNPEAPMIGANVQNSFIVSVVFFPAFISVYLRFQSISF